MQYDDTFSLATLAAQGMGTTPMPHRDIVPPIHLATTFERAEDGSLPGGRIYARDASPAYDPAEALLCKLEGGAEMAKTIAFLTARGIPVMGHIGLQPQSVNTLGGYKAQGRDDAAALQSPVEHAASRRRRARPIGGACPLALSPG